MKSSLATDLLGALGRLAARGGIASKLPLTGGVGSGLVRLLSREILPCASVKGDGIDAIDAADGPRICDECCACRLEEADVEVAVGVVGMFFTAVRLSESPRSGKPLSMVVAGADTSPNIEACLRRGSSNGFTSEVDSRETGDIGRLDLTCFEVSSTGDTMIGELAPALEPVRDLCFAELGTSWSLKPSCELRALESVTRGGIFAFVFARSCELATTGEAVVEPPGVLAPEVSRFLLFLPLSWYRMCGLGFGCLSCSRSVDTERDEAAPVRWADLLDRLPFVPK